MIIGGYQKFSLIDYPGKISSVIWTRGCNFRCDYCHNPQLVYPECFSPALEQEEVFRHLKARVGQLDGVVITGGEPTIHKDLLTFLMNIKELGFKIKIDTNGSNPDMLLDALNMGLVDFIAMDVKAPLYKYNCETFGMTTGDKIIKSAGLIISSDIEHEFRTTLSDFLTCDDIIAMGEIIKSAKNYTLQNLNDRLDLSAPHGAARPIKLNDEERDFVKKYYKEHSINLSIR